MLKLFEKMKEDFNKFCKKTDEMFSKVYDKMRKSKKEKLTLEDLDKLLDSPSVTTNYKFIDVIEVPYKDRTYDVELWWNNKDGCYLAKTLPAGAIRSYDAVPTIAIRCPVRSRKKVEQMMIKRIDEYFEAESDDEDEDEYEFDPRDADCESQ